MLLSQITKKHQCHTPRKNHQEIIVCVHFNGVFFTLELLINNPMSLFRNQFENITKASRVALFGTCPVSVHLYSNVGAPEVYCNIHNIGALVNFDFSKSVFSAIGACTKKRSNTVTVYLPIELVKI